jgi:Asp-tRNA(Asn)/Glu-tRNA(Gln) amidotransferase A subunit family amidase
VKRIKEAGAIVLAKSNMAEFAFSPYETVNSILPGYTRNPYALDRVTAGSSGGTAAAVAANFGAVGLGSDTGNSIRGPASHQALAGIRSTMGLTSRAGVIPLNLLADIAGPMTRTVEDAVAVFQVIVGEDPDDPVTAASHGRAIPDYRQALQRDGLKGARIGILRQAYERSTTDAEIVDVFMAAVEDLKRAGATIVDPARVDLAGVQRPQGGGGCGGFKYDINRYLARCTRSRRSSARVSFTPRSRRGSARRRTGGRTVPTRRPARGTRRIATRSAPRWPRRWTTTGSAPSSIRPGAIRHASSAI